MQPVLFLWLAVAEITSYFDGSFNMRYFHVQRFQALRLDVRGDVHQPFLPLVSIQWQKLLNQVITRFSAIYSNVIRCLDLGLGRIAEWKQLTHDRIAKPFNLKALTMSLFNFPAFAIAYLL